MDTNTYSNDIDSIHQIDRIEFSVLGNDEIVRISSFGENSNGVDILELYDNSEPKKGSLNDPRMGTISHDIRCATCGLGVDCPGHSAHISLAEYVFHIGFKDWVQKILSCVCFNCSKLLIHKNEDMIKEILKTKSPKERLMYIKNATKNVTHCQKLYSGCGTQKPKIKIDIKKNYGAINMIAEMELRQEGDASESHTGEFVKQKTRIPLNAEIVYEILKKISDDDCRIMGIDPEKSRPEDLIHKNFYVPPIQMRPSARGDFNGGMSAEDDLTHKLGDIVRHNIRILKSKDNENTSKHHSDNAHLLQYHVATYMDNEGVIMLRAEQKGRPIKSVSARIKGKAGRIRQNLMGKRGDFTARTVITSDPSLKNNQLRVPVMIATNLTFPEVVGPDNIDWLTSLVRRGKDQYPGANYVFPLGKTAPGQRLLPFDLRYSKEKIQLHYGDIVERHLMDGDVVLLNRQPTLHKHSMMAFRIKVVDDPNLMTFGMSVDITASFNADFDGDEMNIFLPQSMQTQIELEEIACVEKQIINPSTSTTANGTKQDGLVGGYNLTHPSLKIGWRTAMNLITYTSIESFDQIPKNSKIEGTKLYSMIIPPKINLTSNKLKIKNGIISEGRLSDDALGSKKKKTLTQFIWDEYGSDVTENFVDNTRWLNNNFNLWHGFSVGYGDLEEKKEVKDQIDKLFENVKLEVQHLVTEIENNPDLMNKKALESEIYSITQKTNEQGNKLVSSSLDEMNAFKIMQSAGSKGSASNAGQMMGCLGLQAFDGSLMPKKYNGRTMPYFFQNDDTSESRGLVRNSFHGGLDFVELIYQTINGRSGLIDSAIKSVTGDTQIFVLENEKMKCITIGEWIDKQLESNKNKIKHYKEGNMELLDISNKVYIPTCDENGKTSWGEVTAVTRHDPGNNLYEVKTNGGRKVIVAESKSLIIWNENTKQFEMKHTPDVKIGDYVPVTMNLEKPPVIKKHVNIDIDIVHHFTNKFSIPYDKFELNKENGIFIGVFLANGESNTKDGCVSIYNNEKNVKNFIKDWFNKYSIKHKENCKKNETSIKGYSMILAEFLNQFLGENKSIPNEVFTAPDEFIIGLLNGYYSSNGHVGDNFIDIYSSSEKLINGINMLCNRLGIFANMSNSQEKNNETSYRLSIENQWAKIFAEKIEPIDTNKNKKLQEIKRKSDEINFKQYNDVVLDKIIEINKLGIEKYPKLYDMTVPSTYNFAIANGLQCRDTAETGYMQRKLIKSFEDIMVKYDGTVRNANNSIIQFVYGDSGADTISQFEYEMGILEMNNKQIDDVHKFTDAELKTYNFSKKENDDLIDNIRNMRNTIIKTVRRAKLNYIAKIKSFMIPVNLTRVVDDLKESKSEKSNLTPRYIIDKLDELLTNDKTPLVCMNKKEKNDKNSFKNKDEQRHKFVLKACLYDALSPRKVLIEYGLDKETFDEKINFISKSFEKNIVEPGEMIGVIAATATGEPLTQLNLNSFHKAGVSRTNVGNLGVPRMREIFSVSKNPKAPEMKIYLNKEIRNKKEIVHKIKSSLKHTIFGEIRKKITCFYDPNANFNEGITKKDNIIPIAFTQKEASKTSCQKEISHLPFLIRIEMNREKIAEKEIKLLDIVSQFCNWWELRYSDAKNIRKEEKRVMNKITQLSVLCSADNNTEQIIHIRFNAKDYEKDKFDLNTINDFIYYVLDKFKIKGINDITDIYPYPEDKIISFDEETGEFKNESEHVIYTAGVNLKDIRYINGIDLNKTISNNIVEMYNTFGIEIARSLLMSEISNAYSLAGGEVNIQHIEIIVDQMTMTGGLTSIDRHGLNKSDADPLSRASFEKPVEQLWTASLFGEVDYMNGVSSRIMVGSVIKGGTGYCDLLLNTEMLEKSEYEETDYDKKFEEVKTESLVGDILKRSNEEENMFMPM